MNKVTCTTDFVTPKMTGITKMAGSIIIASTAPSVNPDSKMHLLGGTVTGVTAASGTLLTLENDGSGGGTELNLISFLSDSGALAGMYYGVGTDNDNGKLVYTSGKHFVFTNNTQDRFSISAAGLVVIKPAGGAEALIATNTHALNITGGTMHMNNAAGALAGLKISQNVGATHYFDLEGVTDGGAIACSTVNSTGSIYVIVDSTLRRIPYYEM